MAQVQGSPPWSDLPPELLVLVFLHLPMRTDRAVFPAVCRMWCSAARQCHLPPLSPVPWLVLPGGSIVSIPRGETFRLPDGVRYHNSCGEWLLLSRDDDSCFLINPFTKATMPLPSLSSYSYYEEPVEVVGDGMFPDVTSGTWMDRKDRGKISVLSLVVCSTRLIAAIVAVGFIGAIALCRPGASAWSVSANEDCRCVSQMVFFQGKLYALHNSNETEDLIGINIVDEHDSDEPRVSRIERLINGAYLPSQTHLQYMHYLLESHGSLLMVCRKLSYKIDDGVGVPVSNRFEVFEADFEQHLWVEVRTLGNDQALFLGKGCSRAVHVPPYDLSGDCIFFLDDDTCSFFVVDGFACRIWKKTAACGVYDMKDGKNYSPLPMVSLKSERVPATWIFSQGEINKFQAAGGDLWETGN